MTQLPSPMLLGTLSLQPHKHCLYLLVFKNSSLRKRGCLLLTFQRYIAPNPFPTPTPKKGTVPSYVGAPNPNLPPPPTKNYVAQSQPFDLLVSPFWSSFSRGPRRLTFYFWVLWASEKKETKSGREIHRGITTSPTAWMAHGGPSSCTSTASGSSRRSSGLRWAPCRNMAVGQNPVPLSEHRSSTPKWSHRFCLARFGGGGGPNGGGMAGVL